MRQCLCVYVGRDVCNVCDVKHAAVFVCVCDLHNLCDVNNVAVFVCILGGGGTCAMCVM